MQILSQIIYETGHLTLMDLEITTFGIRIKVNIKVSSLDRIDGPLKLLFYDKIENDCYFDYYKNSVNTRNKIQRFICEI